MNENMENVFQMELKYRNQTDASEEKTEVNLKGYKWKLMKTVENIK